MKTSYLKTSQFLVLFVFLVAELSYAQITNWQLDPSNTTQYQVPQGWKVNAGQEQGVYLWQAKENPSNPLGAEISVLSVDDFPNSSPEFFINQLKGSIQAFEILETKPISQDESHYKASGKMQGTKVSCNLIFLRDRNAQLLYLASFSAAEDNYEKLGGTSVLYQALRRMNPFSAENPSKVVTAPEQVPNTEVWNMQSLEVQNHLKVQGIVPNKQALLGKWLQSFSYQTGSATQEVVSGEIFFGERGYGHLFTFNANDTYSLTYKYNSISQGCKYQADFFEKGRFKLEDNQLILYPSGYEGSYNICSKISPEKNTAPPKRTFQLFVDKEEKRLLIIGKPLEYSTSSETDMNGENYIQEGFNKIK